MEKFKSSKKELKGLINDTLQEAIDKLALPGTSKKIKKLVSRNAKKLASVYSDIMKREDKKKRKQEKASTAPSKKIKAKVKAKKNKKTQLVAEAV